jgi:ubiquinone/menaquinone biosynthesis C-methylase UbiE
MLQNWDVAHTIGIDFAEVPLDHFNNKVTEEGLGSRVKIFEQSMGKTFPIPDDSIDLALDIYGSINLRADERSSCKNETYRVLKRGGLFLAYLTSRNSGFVKQMIDCTQGPEPDSVIFANGKFEKVFSEEEIRGFYKDFEIVELKKHNFTVGKYPVEMFWLLLRKVKLDEY